MIEFYPEDGPSEKVREEARKILALAQAHKDEQGPPCPCKDVDGWVLSWETLGSQPEGRDHHASLMNAWWAYVQLDGIFFGDPNDGAFVVARQQKVTK